MMRLAHAHAVDVLLRLAIGSSPAPKHGVVLIDEPAYQRIQIRYHIAPQTYVLFTNRLIFERRPDGSLDLRPCPPRRVPPRPPEGVVVTVPNGPRQTATWYFEPTATKDGQRLVDTGPICAPTSRTPA